jgi:hypothetical protein
LQGARERQPDHDEGAGQHTDRDQSAFAVALHNKGPTVWLNGEPHRQRRIYSIARMGTSEPVRAPPEVSRTRGHKLAKPRSDRIVVEFRALKSAISGSTMGLGGKIMGFSFAAKLRP